MSRRRIGGVTALASILGKRTADLVPVRYRARQRLSAPVSLQTDPEMSSYGQGTLSRSRRRYGRSVRRGTNKYARLITRAAATRAVYGTSDYTTYGGANGAKYLQNWFPGAPGPHYVPCHLYDVTSAPNNVNGSVDNAQCGYKLTFSDPTNNSNVVWLAMGNACAPITAGHTATSPSSVPNNTSMLRGVAAKFLFYSPQTIPTRITVSLIQLSQDKMHPPKTASGSFDNVGPFVADGTLLATVTDRSVVSFWQNVVHSYVKNPVTIGDSNIVSRNLKVLKRHSFILNPKETSDNTAATYHAFNFYHKFNRKCKYDWADQDKVDLRTDDESFQNVAANKCSVEPRARMYLMVTADSVYNNGTEQVLTGAPSYDVSLRFYHDDVGS